MPLALTRKAGHKVRVRIAGRELWVWWNLDNRGHTRLIFDGPIDIEIERAELIDQRPLTPAEQEIDEAERVEAALWFGKDLRDHH